MSFARATKSGPFLKTLGAIFAAIALFAFGSTQASANVDDQAECEEQCMMAAEMCEEVCEEHAGAGAARCKEACEQVSETCIENC